MADRRPRAGPAILPVAVMVLMACVGGCRRESPAAARDRREEALLEGQIAELRKAVSRTEDGSLLTRTRIAIGIAEETARTAFDAVLPRNTRLQDRLDVRLERAHPAFRGNTAGLVLEATARDVRTGTSARLEVTGRLSGFRVARGRLSATVELLDFQVLDSNIGWSASRSIERLARDNRAALATLLPGLDLPVRLDDAIVIDGLDDGVVRARPGRLPLQLAVAEVVPLAGRLWLFVDLKAGAWQPAK